MMHKINLFHQAVTFIIAITSFFFIAGCEQKVKTKSVVKIIDNRLCTFEDGICTKQLDDYVVKLQINPKSAPSEQPINWQLDFSNEVTDLKMRIEGLNMYMGIIPVALSQHVGRSFSGTFMYSTCSTDYMVWRLVVSWQQNGQPRNTWFDFVADND